MRDQIAVRIKDNHGVALLQILSDQVQKERRFPPSLNAQDIHARASLFVVEEDFFACFEVDAKESPSHHLSPLCCGNAHRQTPVVSQRRLEMLTTACGSRIR